MKIFKDDCMKRIQSVMPVLLIAGLIFTGCPNEIEDDGTDDVDDKHFTVTFDLDYEGAAAIAPVKVLKEDPSDEFYSPCMGDDFPQAPVRDGWRFDGWADDDGKKYQAYTVLTENVSLKALWTEYFTISFNLNYNGAPAVPSITVANGEVIGSLPVPDARDGFTFTGWWEGETKCETTTLVTANVTLTAGWFSGWSVTLNDGSDTVLYVEKNGTLGDQFPEDPDLERFNFAGWYDKGNGTDRYDATTPITKDLTLVPQFEKGSGVDRITAVSATRVPAYKFTFSGDDKIGNYTKATAKILVPEAQSATGRPRMWGPMITSQWETSKRFPNNAAPDCLIINTANSSLVFSTSWVWTPVTFLFEGSRDSRYEESNIDTANTEILGFQPDLAGSIVFLIGFPGPAGGTFTGTYYITDIQLENSDSSKILSADLTNGVYDWLEGQAHAGYTGNETITRD